MKVVFDEGTAVLFKEELEKQINYRTAQLMADREELQKRVEDYCTKQGMSMLKMLQEPPIWYLQSRSRIYEQGKAIQNLYNIRDKFFPEPDEAVRDFLAKHGVKPKEA